MPITFANEAAYVAQLAKLVPDMKGGYAEADFIQEALRDLSEDYPAWDTADVGDGATREWTLGTGVFATFAIGFSDLWPVTFELLDAAGNPLADPVEYDPRPAIRRRASGGTPSMVLSFPSAPAAAAKCRVWWQKRWTVGAGATTVPAELQLSVVHKAAAKKCAALSTYYKASIDPAGGSDIFDARQYAEQYANDAERWDAEYAKVIGLGGDETGFVHGSIGSDSLPRVFRPWGTRPRGVR